jgi:hypothetical protein
MYEEHAILDPHCGFLWNVLEPSTRYVNLIRPVRNGALRDSNKQSTHNSLHCFCLELACEMGL